MINVVVVVATGEEGMMIPKIDEENGSMHDHHGLFR